MVNKFLNNIDNTPLHSNGYAEAANAGSIGAASPQVFSQRMQVEGNRRSVRKYRDSLIAHGHRRDLHFQRIDIVNTPARPMPEPKAKVSSKQAVKKPTSSFARQAPVARTQVHQSYIEPPTRGYNPYK